MLNFGSLNIDYVYSVSHIVAGGETIHSQSLASFAGGKGLNQSIAMARAGVAVHHAGMVGQDGRELLDMLKENGVDTGYIKVVNGRSGHAIIQLSASGENSIVLYGGANRALTEGFIDDVLAGFGRGDVLLLQNEVNLVNYIIERGHDKGMRIALNPSPFDDAITQCDLGKIDIFIVNQIEGMQITGEGNTDTIPEKIRQMFPSAIIVLTLGENGSVLVCKDGEFRQPAFKVPVIDTTGAGDTYTGYILMGLLNGDTYQDAMALASKAAALTVSVKGAANSIPSLEEVKSQRF